MTAPTLTRHAGRTRATAGSTLLLALWALFLLSAVIMAWAKFINAGIDVAGENNRLLEAEALAHSGVQVALHPVVSSTTPLLDANFGNGQSYHVTIVGEGARINLNYMLAGEDPIRIGFLKRYLELRGLNFQEREIFMDCLLDWVDPDNARRLNGEEDEGEYHAPNRGFLLSLDEIPLIKGSGPLVASPNWRNDFTLISSGPLDLQWVSAEFLGMVPGIGPQRAQRFVEIRQGKDRKDGTEDDHRFSGLPEALSYLGFSQAQFSALSGILNFKDPVVRIHSVGESGKAARQIDVIAKKPQGGNGEIIQWTEH